MGEGRTPQPPAEESLTEGGGGGSCSKSLDDVQRESQGLMATVKQSDRSALFVQVLATIAVGWAQVSGGATVVLSGAILPQLTNVNTSDLFLNEDNAAFFSSSPNMGATVGCLVAGMLMVILGQRITVLVVLPIGLISWIIMAFSNAILVVQVMRIIQGVCTGILTVAPNVYVAELADKRHRGILDGIVSFVRSVGIFLPFGLGAASMHWRHIALVCGIVSTVPPFLGLLFFPNSPRWLASNELYEEAEKALKFFRGQRCDITSEMQDLRTTVANNKIQPTLKSQFLQLRNWTVMKKFLILSFIVFAAQFSGYTAIFSYALNIFESVASGLDSTLCTLILGLFRSLASVCYILIIERINRRKALLISFITCAVSMTCMGAYFYVQLEVDDPELLTILNFLPLTCALVHIFFSFSGINLVLLMKLETLPLSFRSLGSGLVDAFCFLSVFLVVQTYPYMNKSIKPYGTFWIYVGWCLVTAFVSVTFLPETRGRTLEVIELSSRTKSRGRRKYKYQEVDDVPDPSRA